MDNEEDRRAHGSRRRRGIPLHVSVGMSMSSLANYSQSLVTQDDSMCPEKRQARGWTDAFRDNAAKVVSEGSLSLFDQIGS